MLLAAYKVLDVDRPSSKESFLRIDDGSIAADGLVVVREGFVTAFAAMRV
jgi:hypothetical protein